VVARVDEFDVDRKVTVAPRDLADKQRLRVERLANRAGVALPVFVLRNQIERLHLQLGQLRQMVDESRSQVLAQAFDLWIIASNAKRQHGQRLDPSLAQSQISRHTQASEQQNQKRQHAAFAPFEFIKNVFGA